MELRDMTLNQWLEQVDTPWEKHEVVQYASDGNTVVHKNAFIRKVIDNLYLGKPSNEGSWDVRAKAYIYYPDIDIALQESGLSYSNPMDMLISIYRNMGIETTEKLIQKMDELAAENWHIKDSWIAIASRVSPGKVPAYRKSKENYRARKEEERKKRDEEWAKKEAEEFKQKQEESNAMIQEAVNIFKNGGVLHNDEITIWQDVYDGKSYALVNHLARLYDVKIPLRTQGWIANSLKTITVKDGKMTGGTFCGKTQSKVVWTYINQLIEKANKEEIHDCV